MAHICQDGVSSAPADRPVIVVAGVAGSGKTTLGRALSRTLAMPLLDLDSLTVPLLDALADLIPGTHWNGSGTHSQLIRAARYAVLRSAAADIVAVNQRPLLVAPFTSELTAGEDWDALCAAVAPAPIQVLYVDGAPELLASRRLARGAARDVHRPPDRPPTPPSVRHLRVDAVLTTDEQVALVTHALGAGRA